MAPLIDMNNSNLFNDFCSSKICAKISNVFVAVKQPAHPHALSLSSSKWGALSVPRKNLGDPDVAAFTQASL